MRKIILMIKTVFNELILPYFQSTVTVTGTVTGGFFKDLFMYISDPYPKEH
jgi:hypothetical protein